MDDAKNGKRADVTAPRWSLADLRSLTQARVGLGRTGISLPTQALLEFTLDHARARDAVHTALDQNVLAAELNAAGLPPIFVASQAADRHDYLKRPDLGRKLDAVSRERLAQRNSPPCDVAIVIGDGLSPAAVNAHAGALVRSLLPMLAQQGLRAGAAIVAAGARVALGDEIGAMLQARMVVMLIGERPGLSAPHSLGAYLTFGPRPGRSDADRNCVSNIHEAGLHYDEAAFKIAWLVREAIARNMSGVALKDESGDVALLSLAGGAV